MKRSFLSRSLIQSVTLGFLSITSAVVFGGSAVLAGEGQCGDSPKPCKETTQPNQPKISIKYRITNQTQRTLKFALPSGKIYQLVPGQQQNYQNTTTPDRLRVYLFGENKFYPLSNGNYHFRQNTQGQIKLVRVREHLKVGVHRSKLPTRPPRRTPPSSFKPEIYNPPTIEDEQSETILPLLIDKVGDILIELIKQQPTASQSPDPVSEAVQPPETATPMPETETPEIPTPETTNPDPSSSTEEDSQ